MRMRMGSRVSPPSRNARAPSSAGLLNSRGKRAHSRCANEDVDLTTGQQAGAGQEAAKVVAWRRARLRHAGFDPALAEALSREPGVDLHALTELVERGCPPPLAARILAPLDHERRRG